MPVVSGGARGVDQIAMSSALEAGGVVVGVLADSLLRRSVSREARYALADGRLLLISPYDPEAGFNVGTAMGRNKLIYALADYGLVVSADYGKGGTWEGAQEELRRKPGRSVFVHLTGSVPAGNRKLVELGALGFPSIAGSQDPVALLREAVGSKAQQEHESELPLFKQPLDGGQSIRAVREDPSVFERRSAVPTPPSPQAAASIYDAALPVILAALAEPVSTDELSMRLDVSKTQLQAWLKRALVEEKVRKLGRPVRYLRV
jgi:predicted Rossmann fold nucleotide-binding protein DprA/Smf involved in DNA uptake